MNTLVRRNLSARSAKGRCRASVLPWRTSSLQSSEKLLGFLKFTCVSSVTALCLFLNQFVHNFVLEYHQKTGKQLKNYHDCRLRLSIILSQLGLKLVAQVGSTETSCFDLAILLFTQSRSQGTVDKMLTRWRPDLSATVEEAENTLCCLAQRIINAQHRYVAAPRSWRELVGASGAEALKRQKLTANRIRWNFCLC